MLGEYLGAGAGTTKLLLHLSGNSTDSSGNGNNGTDTNITYGLAYGKFGQGADFNGTNSKIAIADHESLRPSGNFTFSAWINTTDNDYGYLFQSFDTIIGNNNEKGWWIRVTNNGTVQIYIVDISPADVNLTTAATVNDGVWHLINAIYNGTTVKIYIDGVEKASANFSGSLAYYSPNLIRIGCWDSTRLGQLYTFDGSIDEVIVENVAWSAEKVKKYYSASKGRWATL